MRLVTVATAAGPRACVWDQGEYVDVQRAGADLPASVREILALGRDGLGRVAAVAPTGPVRYDPAECVLAPPVPDPGKIVCLGLNYRDHAREIGAEPPALPILFSKYPSSLIGSGAAIVLPAISAEVDFEAELVVVIGGRGKNVAVGEALGLVGGYMVGNDVSARDWQLKKPGKQWMAGKTCDTFAPTGPELVTADDVPDPHDLGIRLRLNGATMQDSNTHELIFRVDAIVAHLSTLFTLEPGDLIFTGTPPGVGMARRPPVWLRPGDRVEVEIDGLGTLVNPVAAG